MVKNLPTMQETWVQSLGWEDPLEWAWQPTLSILAWRIPWTEQSGGLESMGSQRVGHDWATNVLTEFYDVLKLHDVFYDELKRWEYQTTLPASWETYMQVKKQQLELTWNNGLVQNWERLYILSPYLFNLYAEYIMGNARLDEAQGRIKISKRNINSLRYVDDTTLMAESEEEPMRWKRRVKKLA